MTDMNKRAFLGYAAGGVAAVTSFSSLLVTAAGADEMPESNEKLASGEKK